MKKTKPFFTIIIPALNEEHHLPLLLNDLALQTDRDFKVIVVDGRSNDRTVEFAKKFTSLLNLQIIISKIRNVSYQRNLGARQADTDILLFMDADNRLETDFIGQLKRKIQKFRPAIFSNLISVSDSTPFSLFLTHIANFYFSLQINSRKPSVLEALLGFDRQVFQKLGGFDSTLNWGEGGALIEKAVRQGYSVTLFDFPRYHYSLRRFQGKNALRNTLTVVRLEAFRLLGLKLSPAKLKALYPMDGGQTQH